MELNKEKYLQNIGFWKNLSENEKKYALDNSVERTIKKGELVQCNCDTCTGLVYIVTGTLRASMITDEGREITLFRLPAGEICIMSASCVVHEITFQTEIIAKEDTQVIVINALALKRLIDTNIYVKAFTYEHATGRFSTALWLLQEVMYARVDKRLASYLISISKETNSDTIKSTQEEIAKDINTSREAVTRMLKHFIQDEIVSVSRGQIKLLNKSALKKLTET